MRNALAAIASVLLACAPALAGAEHPRAARDIDLHRLGWLPPDVFDVGEGLPDPTVNAIAVLPDGEVWIATMRGLARQAGTRLVTEPGPAGAAGKAILDLAATPDGALLASIDGLGVYRLQDAAWQALGRPFGTAHVQRLRVASQGARTRVFAAGPGVAEWIDGRWHARALPAALADAQIHDVALQFGRHGRPDTLWLASAGDGLHRCVGSQPCVRLAIDAPGPRTDEVRRLQLQASANGRQVLWLALQGGGVARLADGTWTRWHAGNSVLPSDFVYDLTLVPGPEGVAEPWFGTRSGLAILRSDGRWTPPDPRVPQLHDRVRTLALARTSQGVPLVWAGSDRGAVRIPLEGAWRMVSNAGERANGVLALLLERSATGMERAWVASDGDGLARYEGGHWRQYTRRDGLPHDTVRSLLRVPDGTAEGALWVGAWGGHLLRLQGERFTALPTPWPKYPDEALTLLLADRGTVWASTRRHGVARWDGKRWDWWPASGAMPRRAYSAVRHGRDVWFSTSDLGLARYREGRWRFFREQIGLRIDPLYDMRLLPDGDGRPVLWVGSRASGLLRVDISDPERPRLVTRPALPTMPGLPVYGAVRDRRGDLLACTDYGVFRWRTTAHGLDANVYHRADGLPHDECNANAMGVDDRGRVWVGTIGGAAVYTPPNGSPRRPSPLRITRVLVDGSPVRIGNGSLALPRADSQLELHYTLLTGEREAASRYRVTLAGVPGATGPGMAWTDGASHRFARLPAGTRRMRIEAMDHAGVAAVPVEFDVVVPRAWWQTTLARIVLLLAAIAAVWVLLRLRERQLLRGESRLRTMVHERTQQLWLQEHQLRRANDELRRMSYTDALTGLGNRRRLFESLERQCEVAAATRTPLALLLLDLDHFKNFNDTHGHLAGDRCLQQVAGLLQASLRAGALPTRYGGEEFCVLLPGLDADEAARVAERLRSAVEAMPGHEPGDEGCRVTASIGVAAGIPQGPQDVDRLLASADAALYRAKALGRNRVERASD